MTIQGFLHFLLFVNNISVTGASIFLLLLIIHLPFYQNQFGITKILKQTVNTFTLKNFLNKISFSDLIFLTPRTSLEREMKWRLVIILTINLISCEKKFSNQFPKFGKTYSISSSLVLLDHQLYKNNSIVGI